MIKVVCIDNTIGNARHLGLNKVYDASEVSPSKGTLKQSSKYYIINTYPFEIPIHNGIRLSTKHDIWIDKKSFISLEEFRQLKLDNILNNEI